MTDFDELLNLPKEDRFTAYLDHLKRLREELFAQARIPRQKLCRHEWRTSIEPEYEICIHCHAFRETENLEFFTCRGCFEERPIEANNVCEVCLNGFLGDCCVSSENHVCIDPKSGLPLNNNPPRAQ